MCYVGIFKYNLIVKEENDDDESNSDSVPSYPSCGECGKMFPTKVTLAQHMIMQHEEENEGNNDMVRKKTMILMKTVMLP